MVMAQNPDLNILYAEFDKTKDTAKFIQNLKALSNGTLQVNDVEQVDLTNILSSPEDSRLQKRKKAKAMKQPVKAPEMFGDSVQCCDEGLSPKVTFTKRKYEVDEYEDSDSD
jgi:hypothetical protein